MTSEQCSAACSVTSDWNSKNADVLLNSGLNLFDIMANLYSKLYCEVLLKSGNYIVHLLKWTSALDFCKIDLSGLKLSVNIANLCSKLLCTEVKEVYQIFRNQTLVL